MYVRMYVCMYVCNCIYIHNMPPDAHLFYCFPQVFPAICAAIFLVINIVIWAHQSSMAVPFGTFLVVVVLWFVISLPLVFLGAYLGFRKDVISVPCRTNQIPREVPPQLWYQGLLPSLVRRCLQSARGAPLRRMRTYADVC
jgi:hypothetical protein